MKKTQTNLVVFAIVFIALLPSKLFSQQFNQPDWVINMYKDTVHNYMFNGTNVALACRILMPKDFDKTKKYPVVVTLHGASGFSIPGSKDYNINNLRAINGQLADDAVRSKYGMYVIALQANKLSQNSSEMWGKKHFEGLKKIIAVRAATVDMNRIYVMGQSAGGNGTGTFISLAPTYFAAAISAGSNASDIPVAKRASLVNFNLWHMVGENDTKPNRFGGSNDFFTDMKSRNAKMKYTTFRNVGHSTEDFMVGSYGGTSGTFTKLDTDEATGVVKTKEINYTTWYASDSSDRTANTLDWLFSKSLLGPVALNKTRAPQKPTINFDRANAELNYSKTEAIDQIVVYNLNGVVVLKTKKTSGNSLNLSSLKAGLYVVKTYQDNGDVSTTKIMK